MCTDGILLLYNLENILSFDVSAVFISAVNTFFVLLIKSIFREEHAYITTTVIIIVLVVALAVIIACKRKIIHMNTELRYHYLLSKSFNDANENLEYLKDENFRYVMVNKAALDFFGLKGEEEIIGRDDFDISEEEFAHMCRNTDIQTLEKMHELKDEVIWQGRIYHTTKFPVLMQNGKYGVGAYGMDITEKRARHVRLEKALQCSRIQLDLAERQYKGVKELLGYSLERGIKLSDSSGGCIYRYDDLKNTLSLVKFDTNSYNEETILTETIALDKSEMLEKAVVRKEGFFTNIPLNNYTATFPFTQIITQRYIVIPAVLDRKIKGLVILWGKQQDYTQEDIIRLTVLVSGIVSITSRKEAQNKLTYERKKYLNTLISIGDGVMTVDKDGNIEMINNAAQLLTGWTNEQTVGLHYKEVFRLSHETEGMEIKDPIESAISTGKVQELVNHAILTSRSGEKFFIEDSAAPIRDSDGNVSGVVLVFRDVTERKEQRRKIEYLSYHDALTGLYNRRFFESELQHYENSSFLPVSIIMGDINGLKLTNDVFGHASGDILLQKIADIMKNVLRKDDIASRWGGDEFIMLLPNTGLEEAQKIIKNIRQSFAKEKVAAIMGSISMGCDVKSSDSMKLSAVLDNAEQEMYRVKSLERENVESTTITSIIETLHGLSEVERDHSFRVSRISQNIGKAMNLPEREIRKLKDAGFLHDIGKIAFGNDIQDAKSEMNEHQKKEYRRHAVIGYRILNTFDHTLDLAECVLSHHEKWDGSGYPKGLKEEEIPLLARIISAAEFYEQVTRVGKDRLFVSMEDAKSLLTTQSGSRLDPAIVDVMLKLESELLV